MKNLSELKNTGILSGQFIDGMADNQNEVDCMEKLKEIIKAETIKYFTEQIELFKIFGLRKFGLRI